MLDNSPPLRDLGSATAGLSAREREVLAMASDGLTNNDIATRLDVTVHAVKWHLASVYRKLGVGNRTEAAITYLRATSAEDERGETG